MIKCTHIDATCAKTKKTKTGDTIGKVDQILDNETNSELWKASVLLLK